MKWARAIGSELIGLFVDDAGFAVAIIVWLILCGLLLPHLPLPPTLLPVLLFLGLAGILAQSVWRVIRK